VRRTLLTALIYVLAACAFTWPLVLHLHSLFGAIDPTGDPALYLWTLGWDLHTISTHPTWLLTGRVFDAPVFFPAHHTLAYSDHLLLQAVALWPVYAISHDLVLCYNVLLIASLAASALAMHVLARALVGSERAAYVAGAIFGFAPYHFTHLTHIQLQALYFLPLSFFFLHRLFRSERGTDAVALGLVMGLQALSSIYYGLIGAIGIATGAAILVVSRAISHEPSAMTGESLRLEAGATSYPRLMLGGVTAGAIALLVALPWSLPYLRVEREAAAGRNLYEVAHGSAVLASYVQAPPTNMLYGRTGWLQPSPDARLPRKSGPEQALFPGFCAILLALFGVLTTVAQRRSVLGEQRATSHAYRATTVVAVYAGISLVGIVLSLGPDGLRPLYAFLYQSLFGMAAIRAAARFSVLALSGIAVLAAVGMRELEIRWPRAKSVVAGCVLAVVGLESANGVIAYPSAPTLSTNAGRWLRQQQGAGAVVCVPMGFDTGNTKCMLQSLEHGRPVVNGYSSVRPAFYAALVDAMRRLPSPDSLLTLHDLGVEYIVSHGLLTPEPTLTSALIERARFDDQRIYQTVWSPAIESAVSAVTDPVPREPGPVPFAAGESATYRVRWTSGPMNLPAGEATISVAEPQGPEAFRFVMRAETASWVSSFFEADAQLETTATDRLLPLEHRENIVDGKRRIERRLEFDAVRHEVRMTTGGAAITLPLATEARDPLTALFYVRTLPFQAGAGFVVPLSDNGRRSRLDVTVDGLETIQLDGRARPAWKLEPRLSERVERQAPRGSQGAPGSISMLAWLSADTRRIPLVVEISAAFGSVRVELVNSRDRE